MHKLTTHEIGVLQMLAGERDGEWGARVGECLEALQSRGLCTPWPDRSITESGRQVLKEMGRG